MNKEQLIIKIKRLFIKKGKRTDTVIIFDSAMDTQNKGDEIIMLYCGKIIEQIWGEVPQKRITFHKSPSEEETTGLANYKYKILCGTNVLSPNVEYFCAFKTSRNLDQYHDICLLGVGWGMYSDNISRQSKDFYRCILSKQWLHSVRDRYTEQKMKEMGFNNVLFTACPTMWNLTTELCDKIPKQKSEQVVFSITDYDQNEKCDNKMIKIIERNYGKIYFWAQGQEDIKYLKKLNVEKDIVVINKLEEYTELLKGGNIDYIGTRLHAGIHALNQKIRTIIVAIDNRAEEMGKDTNLPIILREDIGNLENMINTEWKTEIVIPNENINKWKAQFQR